jgi:transposase
MKALAVLLYAMGNASFGMIGRLLGVSDVAVLKWVRAQAQAIEEPVGQGEVVEVMLDEMWHFVQKKVTNFGSGVPMTLCIGELWPGFSVAVMMQAANVCSTKSIFKARGASQTVGKDFNV